MPKTCPFCGHPTLETHHGNYRFDPPPNVPGGTIVLPDATWDECSTCGKQLLAYEVNKRLEREAADRRETSTSNRA